MHDFKYSLLAFMGWSISYLPILTSILQILVLLVSLLLGIIGLYKAIKEKRT
jgi:uncharacterized membrane protein